MSSREQDFKRIKAAIEPELILSVTNALAAKGDSLPLLRKLPAHSVSLILTDPPYHATKTRNIYGDTAFAEDQHYLEWMGESSGTAPGHEGRARLEAMTLAIAGAYESLS